jgi:hypothetical protein
LRCPGSLHVMHGIRLDQLKMKQVCTHTTHTTQQRACCCFVLFHIEQRV